MVQKKSFEIELKIQNEKHINFTLGVKNEELESLKFRI